MICLHVLQTIEDEGQVAGDDTKEIHQVHFVQQECTVVKQADINARGGKSTFFPVNIYPWHCFFIYGIDILRCLEVKKNFFGPHICPYQLPYPLIPPSTVVVLYTGGF